jgi:hypothetical protein
VSRPRFESHRTSPEYKCRALPVDQTVEGLLHWGMLRYSSILPHHGLAWPLAVTTLRQKIYESQSRTAMGQLFTVERDIKGKIVAVLNELSTRPRRRMGSWRIDPYFLDLGTSWRWVVSFVPRPLYPQGKSPRYSLDRRLGGSQSRSGRHVEVNTTG